MGNDNQYVTKEGYEKLIEELENLKTNKRQEIAEKITRAKEFGDLSENAEYSAAKEEQAQNETRIAQIEQMLKTIQVIDEKRANNGSHVDVGSTITISEVNGKDEKEYKIVGREEANPTQGLISNESPLGEAFLGKKKGEEVEVVVPKGKIKFKIVDIK